jgi:type I restriction enzyme S subunit
MDTESELLENWTVVPFGKLVQNFDGKRKPLSAKFRESFKGEFPYYGACDIIDSVKDYLFDGEYILIGEDGANLLSKNKPLAFVVRGKFWVNNHAHICQPVKNVDIKYLLYQFNSKNISQFISGTAQPKLNQANLNKIPFKVSPLSEQKAIVEKIEELFSELDKAIENLKTAQQQLKVYRQAVLKWAFEGKLTNEDVGEGELPEGWITQTFDDVCVKIGDIDHKMPKTVAEGVPYVSTKDFTDDLKISFKNAKYISEEDYLTLSRKIKPERGDIIFPRYGTIGKNILVDFEMKFLVSYSCAVVKPNIQIIYPKYLYLYSLSPQVHEEIRKYVVETTQANIGIASIKKFIFNYPENLDEQLKVIDEIESRLSVCDKIEETITNSLQQAEALRQSILKRAFEGKLVQLLETTGA